MKQRVGVSWWPNKSLCLLSIELHALMEKAALGLSTCVDMMEQRRACLSPQYYAEV